VNNRRVGTYALMHMIVGRTDAEAKAQADAIVAGADHGAIANIMASASMDTNAGGIAERLKSGLSLGLEEGNMAFMGIPVLCGSPGDAGAAHRRDRSGNRHRRHAVQLARFRWWRVHRILASGLMPLLKCRN